MVNALDCVPCSSPTKSSPVSVIDLQFAEEKLSLRMPNCHYQWSWLPWYWTVCFIQSPIVYPADTHHWQKPPLHVLLMVIAWRCVEHNRMYTCDHFFAASWAYSQLGGSCCPPSSHSAAGVCVPGVVPGDQGGRGWGHGNRRGGLRSTMRGGEKATAVSAHYILISYKLKPCSQTTSWNSNKGEVVSANCYLILIP